MGGKFAGHWEHGTKLFGWLDEHAAHSILVRITEGRNGA